MKSNNIIARSVFERVQQRMFQGKAIILMGPRQSGKTTLVKQLFEHSDEKSMFLNADEPDVRHLLENCTSVRLRMIFGDHRIVCIDEAQRVENIGITLKLITDEIQGVQVVATGSSALELNSSIVEPLTGRKFEFHLYPFSYAELSAHSGFLNERRCLEERLIYGCYPEVVTSPGQKEELIRMLASSYLYKDLHVLDGLKKPALLDKIVQALALQLGCEVSFQEVAQLVGADGHTVERYIDLLEKAYVVFRVPAYSRNVRNEIKKGKKIYFLDNGVRNAIIGNFLPVSSRTDIGALWENYLMSERRKLLDNKGVASRGYFWRTTQQQEIDYIEEREQVLSAFEFKWNHKKKNMRLPMTFTKAYPLTRSGMVTSEDYEQFLTVVEG
ncbi:MAG: ATP-binding protein [Kiritimatiellae bacterium]|nr:ATP-binding protein [Kiritimatiellia bacterium]MDD4737452.1 ATP-binding protein [Kiritimatiellia bacterium]